jgi:4-alpha-glucanotransferase
VTVHPDIERRYRDARGGWRQVPDEALARLNTALRADDDEASVERARVVRPGRRVVFDEPAELILESGSRERLHVTRRKGSRRWRAALPADLPLGYHTVEFTETGRQLSLIAAPAQCHLPAGLRIWGWAVQLYAARSRRSWGIGDLGDLARLAAWAERDGAGLLLVNPLHAATPVVPQQRSPYSPTTRRFFNPLYLAIEEVPGARALPNLPQLAKAGARLNARPLIERDAVFALKMRALGALFARFNGDAAFDAFVAAGGPALREYATFCVLAETHGGNWRKWPARYRDPRSSAVRRFADAQGERVRYHQWLQWLLDAQLARASARVPVMQDLPIGFDASSADAWAWQDVVAEGVSVGAPPDEFNTQGQNWGLPPFIPARLRRAGYRPFIETIRGTLRHAGGLRIDHVMGLFRLFWIPEGLGAVDGAYVRNEAEALLAIIALESERAQAIVVGEDLGTVDEKLRQQLLDANVLSYRLLWFEKDHPRRYPAKALAAVTTHDLPTVTGLLNGSDLRAQHDLGLEPNEEGMREMGDRVRRLTRTTPGTPLAEAVRRTHAILARAPSTVLTATLDDAALAEKRPNMPGTVDQWPNWSLPLPQPIERLQRSPVARAIARALGRGRRRR